MALLVTTVPLAVCLPPEATTVGDLVRHVVRRQSGDLGGCHGEWEEHEVWETIRQLTDDESGAKLEEVTREARFVDDLGMGQPRTPSSRSA